MRLTLRTLLAHLDDILSPEDSEQLNAKINESEFAASLVSRIRDVTRRLRLGAPKLEGRGLGLDPNTVAEYLDNTLSTERVPDFEKVCLESDVHLAEVASCHQILTLVLGEPAEVDQHSRERMYELVHHADESGETATDNRHRHDGEKRRREKPEIPDYLRPDKPSRARWMLIAAGLLVAAGLGLAGYQFMSSRTGQDLAGRGPDAEEAAPGSSNDEQDNVAAKSTNSNSGGAADEREADRDLEMPVDEGMESTDASSTDDPLDSRPDSGLPPGPLMPEESEPLTVVEDEPAGAPADPPEPDPAAPVPSPTETADTATTEGGAEPTVPVEEAEAEEAGTEPPVSVGRFVSEGAVLLRQDRKNGEWQRVPVSEAVSAGDTLVVVPGYRARINVGIGIDLQILGGTRIELMDVGPDGVPGVSMPYGRIVMMPAAKDGTQLRLRLAGREGTLTFTDSSTIVAAEVRPYRVAGTSADASSRQIVDLLVSKGPVAWDDAAGGDTQTLAAPLQRRLQGPLDGEPLESEVDLPQWMFARQESPAEQLAAKDLEKAFSLEKSANLNLKEQAASPRRAVRSIAAQGLAHLGEFESLIEAISDEAQDSAWRDHVQALMNSMARGPQTAEQIRAAVEKQHPAGADELFRMLCGYTPEQLESGEAARLVEYLDHKDLIFRILGFWNLQTYTGMSGLFYQPHDDASERQRPVQRWQQKLRDGELVPKAATP